MKKASKVLGIVGGAISLLLCAVSVFIFTLFMGEFQMMADMPGFFLPLFYGFITVAAVGGILGLIGGCLVDRKRILAGVFMAISGATNFLSSTGFIAAIMLILGAVFAFLPDKNGTAPGTPPPADASH